MTPDRLALERSSYWDSDESRGSYQFKLDTFTDQHPPIHSQARVLLDPTTCKHMSKAHYSDRAICLQCEATLTGKDAEFWGHLYE